MKIRWEHIKILFSLSLVIFLFSFSSKRNSSKNITGKEIVFLDNLPRFIGLDAVNKLLIQNESDTSSIAKETLDLNEMEKRLSENPMIAQAEVFMTIDGVLKAHIRQRKPVARIASSATFYIDDTGTEMPLSGLYSARVPLVTGEAEGNFEPLSRLLATIEKDPVLRQQIIGIHIESEQDFYLLPRVYNYKIAIGEVENLDQKFKNYKAFYQKTIKDSTITNFSQINLKFDKQVVATKKQ